MGKRGKSQSSGGPDRKKAKDKMYYQKQGRRGNRGGGGGWRSGNQNRHPVSLEVGMKGFLCTTNFKEKEAVHEAYNLLNEYYDESVDTDSLNKTDNSEASGGGDTGESQSKVTTLNPETETNATGGKKADDDEEDDDIESALKNEIKSLKQTEWRFKSVQTGVKNVVFVKTTIGDPVKLVHKILENVTTTKQQKSRFLIRILPIEMTCKADVEQIVQAAKVLFTKYLKTGYNSYQILYKCRYNNSLSREAIIRRLAEEVDTVNPLNVVNLNDPTYTVVVEILQTMCCLSIVTDFNKFRKYNLIETSMEQKAEKEKDQPEQQQQSEPSVPKETEMNPKDTDKNTEEEPNNS